MVSLSYAIFLAAVIGLIMLDNYGYGYWLMSRPVFAGPLLGLIMGDIKTGLIVGASVELMYMGVLPIGASIPPNAQIAGLMGTAFAILSGGKPEVGITLAVPIGAFAQFLIILAWNFNIFLVHKADRHIMAGEVKKVEKIHLSGLVVFFLVAFIPSFLAIYFGSTWVNAIVTSLPKWVMDGLRTTSTILPAIGMAMLLKMMDFKKYWGFFLIGFVLAIYLKLNVLSIALLGLGIASTIFVLSTTKEEEGFNLSPLEEQAEGNARLIDDKTLLKVFRRSFFTMTTINYERFCNLGFNYSMIPVLERLYPNKEDFIDALNRHNEFFNCHPYPINAILGVTIALEEQRALGNPISPEIISSTKTALMGPLSGIGDSIFKATFMTMFAAIGSALALQGNILGPIIFIVPNVALNILTRYYGLFYGYKFGTNLLMQIKNSDILDKFVQGATIIGLLVTGAMVVNFVKLDTTIVGNFNGAKIVLQDMLNSILPGLLPLSITLWFYSLLKKKNAIYILIAISFIIGMVGKYFMLVK